MNTDEFNELLIRVDPCYSVAYWCGFSVVLRGPI
jgi:hypothetical protein